jgi:plasmid stability protein
MATLQVREMEDGVYQALKSLARSQKRSLSQEVIFILEEHLKNPRGPAISQTEAFLGLSGGLGRQEGEKLLGHIRRSRKNSPRFGVKRGVFD